MNNYKKSFHDLSIEIIGAGLVAVIIWLAGFLYFPLPAWVSFATLIVGLYLGWVYCLHNQKVWKVSDLLGL